MEILLEEMGFQTNTIVNYVHHHIISTRIWENMNKPFEHQEVEGLVEKSNSLDYPSPMHNEGDMQQDPTSPV